ncbi:acyl carrier protein [Nocardia tenerifensis]|uniref:Acyl carrier protein n=1 Tax=Nocardia tenerifensis TaxID=228006 RepID=A0A318KGT3_9NOCA|nr:phosphopantetheine-binding protein [Nocardia tenerifensis]PXX71472.1 acyl carrier protein [Nocardia tenerifensis]
MWDDKFEELLRGFLPFLSVDEPLDGAENLRDLGLDSVGTVELLAQLEDAYDVRFLDDLLNMDTFATPAVLWATLTEMTAPAS